MELGDVENYGDLVNFFMGRGFEGYNEEFREFNVSKLYKIRLKEIDRSPESIAELSRYRTELKGIGQNVTHYLLYTSDFSKFIFMRQIGDPFRFAYDKDRVGKLPTETRLSLLKKLGGLKYKDEVFNETIENLFDVKEIVNTFFKEYKDIVKKLSGGITIKDVNPELYAQVLMDRIIFLYFLQTKGVLDEKYLSDNYHGKDKGVDYYGDFLRPLFFEILNNEKHDKDKDIVIRGINFGRLPYLNGGLFREKDFEKGDIEVDNSVWGEVFGLLNRYEWVVEEQKGDSTVLTPAILGHIYEKSVIAATQKETGSYYTPQEITNYISMNTIYPYLTDRVNEKFGTDYRYIKGGEDRLLDKKKHDEREIEIIRYLYFDVLKRLTVLDNACGSGAFLVAALYVLIPLYRKSINILREKDKENFEKELEEIGKHQTLGYYVKRTIITNNLYGVDIQEGAVEIAKLRMWLSMVSDVDKDNVEPLPNIDYNIMPGNSLIGFVEPPDSEQFGLTTWTLEEIKPETVKDIMRIKGDLVNDYKKTQGSEHAEKLKDEIENINKRFRPSLNEKLLREFQDKKIKITEEELKKLNPFHWGFEFYGVFDPEKPKEERGFDVVIGNPPYVSAWGMEESDALSRRILPNIYSNNFQLKSHWDLYVPFIVQATNIAKNNGYFSYILPNPICREKYATEIRRYILENSTIKQLLTAGERNVFVGVSRQSIVFVLKLAPPVDQKNEITVQFIDEKDKVSTINKTQQKIWYDLHQSQFRYEAGSAALEIIDKLNKTEVRLGNIYYINLGAQMYSKKKGEFGKQYLLTKEPKENPKRFFEGKDITRYGLRYRDLYMDYLPNIMYDGKCIELFESPKIITRQISGKNDSLIFTLDREAFYCDHNLILATDYKNLKPENRTKFEGYDVIENHGYAPEFILTILNSRLMSFLYKNVYATGSLQGSYSHVYPKHVRDFPIADVPSNQTPFIRLCNYMLFLNKTEELRKSEKDLIDFIDKQIIDSLIYELYFKDELKTNLLELVEPYLKETDNLDEIREIVDEIKSDRKIMETIDKIKSHEWVRIIEGG